MGPHNLSLVMEDCPEVCTGNWKRPFADGGQVEWLYSKLIGGSRYGILQFLLNVLSLFSTLPLNTHFSSSSAHDRPCGLWTFAEVFPLPTFRDVWLRTAGI